MSAQDAAALLLALAHEELALVAADRWEELDALAQRRAEALAALPAPAPAHLRPVLEQALAAQSAVTEVLTRVRDDARAQLAGTDRVRCAAAAYQASTHI